MEEEPVTQTKTTRDAVRSYYQAWTKGNMPEARSLLADDLDFRGPIDAFAKADDFLVALAGFQRLLTRAELSREFYADDEAALLYDCVTASPAGTIRTAEFFRLRAGKIAEIRLVFDASELRKLMAR
jgi:ketosteroid isomerase-like protein